MGGVTPRGGSACAPAALLTVLLLLAALGLVVGQDTSAGDNTSRSTNNELRSEGCGPYQIRACPAAWSWACCCKLCPWASSCPASSVCIFSSSIGKDRAISALAMGFRSASYLAQSML